VAERPDVVVGVRDWQRISRTRFAPVQVFWAGDAFDQPVLDGLGEAASRPELDFFMLQSDWQVATFRAHHDVGDWAIARTRLGAAASATACPSRPAPTGCGRRLAYPNHYAETFRVAAIEAQAAGCAVVTSQLGALPETVGDGGVCIPGDPRSRAYQDAFVDACVRLLTDDEAWLAASGRARARAWGEYTWARIAAEWETFCHAALTVEPPVLERVAVHLEAGRGSLAQKMLDREASPSNVPADAWQALRTFTAWRAAAGAAPSDEQVRLVALHFRSLRTAVASASAAGSPQRAA
jgi:hypothetical protein